jgi:urease accessory protein
MTTKLPLILTTALLLAGVPALAHEGGAAGGGFGTGFLQPLFGRDHLAAMVAEGTWGPFLGQPAIQVLAPALPSMMAVGGALAPAGVGVPAVEVGIAAFALSIGLMLPLAARTPRAVIAVAGAWCLDDGLA